MHNFYKNLNKDLNCAVGSYTTHWFVQFCSTIYTVNENNKYDSVSSKLIYYNYYKVAGEMVCSNLFEKQSVQ